MGFTLPNAPQSGRYLRVRQVQILRLRKVIEHIMRKVLVTAGASGIGKEVAAAFLSAGDSVYTCDINKAALDAGGTRAAGSENWHLRRRRTASRFKR